MPFVARIEDFNAFLTCHFWC